MEGMQIMSKKILFAVLGVFLACTVSCERQEEKQQKQYFFHLKIF